MMVYTNNVKYIFKYMPQKHANSNNQNIIFTSFYKKLGKKNLTINKVVNEY